MLRRYVTGGKLGWLWLVAASGFSCGRIGYDEAAYDDDGAHVTIAGGGVFDGGAGGMQAAGGGAGATSASVTGSAGTGVGGSGGAGSGDSGGAGGAGGSGVDASSDDALPGDAGGTDVVASCPSSISFGSGTTTPVHGNPSAGTEAIDDCPSGQVVVGYNLYEDIGNELVGRLSTLCGIPSIDAATCSISMAPGATLPLRGMQSSGVLTTQRCSGSQMVVGVKGRSGNSIDQLAFGCAPIMLSKAGSTYQASIGGVTWLPPLGSTIGGRPFEDLCPTGTVAAGSYIRSATWIEAFALRCSTPVLAP